MAELIKYQNIKNPQITGVCTLEEYQAFNKKAALRGKFRIIERNIRERPAKDAKRMTSAPVPIPPEATEAIEAAEAAKGSEHDEVKQEAANEDDILEEE